MAHETTPAPATADGDPASSRIDYANLTFAEKRLLFRNLVRRIVSTEAIARGVKISELMDNHTGVARTTISRWRRDAREGEGEPDPVKVKQFFADMGHDWTEAGLIWGWVKVVEAGAGEASLVETTPGAAPDLSRRPNVRRLLERLDDPLVAEADKVRLDTRIGFLLAEEAALRDAAAAEDILNGPSTRDDRAV